MSEDSSRRSPSISAWTSVPIRSSALAVPATLLGDGGDVGRVLGRCKGGLVDGAGFRRAERLQHVVGPPQEVVAILGRHTEHVADHDHRQGGGDLADEVGRARLADPVDDRVADGVGCRLRSRGYAAG